MTVHKRLLWVEHDQMLVQHVNLLRTKYGWAVRHCVSIDEGVRAIGGSDEFDVVMVDFLFDGESRDGSDLAGFVRSCPNRHGVPFIVFSKEVVRERAYDRGPNGEHYLGKPLTPAELHEALCAVVDGRDVADVLSGEG
ncbi:MAG: hypothetical protein AAFV43_05350 [Planctomycetota bacterium]